MGDMDWNDSPGPNVECLLNELGSIWLNKGLSHSPETSKTLKLRTAETASQSLEQTGAHL
jgi:hypothetical protein